MIAEEAASHPAFFTVIGLLFCVATAVKLNEYVDVPDAEANLKIEEHEHWLCCTIIENLMK